MLFVLIHTRKHTRKHTLSFFDMTFTISQALPERWFEEVDIDEGCFVSSGVQLQVEQPVFNNVLAKRRRSFMTRLGYNGEKQIHYNSWLSEQLSIRRDNLIGVHGELSQRIQRIATEKRYRPLGEGYLEALNEWNGIVY